MGTRIDIVGVDLVEFAYAEKKLISGWADCKLHSYGCEDEERQMKEEEKRHTHPSNTWRMGMNYDGLAQGRIQESTIMVSDFSWLTTK